MLARKSLMLAVALFLGQSAWAQSIPMFITEWGEFGSAPGRMFDPRGIAIHPDGTLYGSKVYR